MRVILALLVLVQVQLSVFAGQHTGNYVVYVVSVEGRMPYSSFENLNGVYSRQTYDGINTYYISGFDTEQEAQSVKEKAVSLGFVTSRVVSRVALEDLEARCCMAAPREDFKIRNVFFDFDKAVLKPEGRAELDKLVSILKDNPSYTAELHAHTDSKGSIEYNVALSKRRRDAAKNYLTARGIDASRISTYIYGEDRPIAKNEVSGHDTPEGRRLNRRVEIKVKDGNKDAGKVEGIDVPNYLEQK